VPFWISIVVLALVAIILWRYTRSRNLMDVAQDDFVQPKAVRDKFLIALAVLSLSLLFAVTHIQQIELKARWRLRLTGPTINGFCQILRHLVFRHHAAAGCPHQVGDVGI
jgi:hypothetical protein